MEDLSDTFPVRKEAISSREKTEGVEFMLQRVACTLAHSRCTRGVNADINLLLCVHGCTGMRSNEQ